MESWKDITGHIANYNMDDLHEVIKENDRLREELEKQIKIKNVEVVKRVPTQVLLEELLKREKKNGNNNTY